jgi:hypothetical protein
MIILDHFVLIKFLVSEKKCLFIILSYDSMLKLCSTVVAIFDYSQIFIQTDQVILEQTSRTTKTDTM